MTQTIITPVLNAAHSGDWQSAAKLLPQSAAMQACMQDPVFHAEGDVWRHTQMVYNSLPADVDMCLKACAIYHDVAKPQTRTEVHMPDRVRISHPHHSSQGAQLWWQQAHQDNWLSIQQRLCVYWLIRYHQKIFHVWNSDHMQFDLHKMAADVDLNELVQFALADTQGRICAHNDQTEQDLVLLHTLLEETPVAAQWCSSAARKFYFEKPHRQPDYVPPEPQGSRVWIMSGLPGSGKDTWIANNLPGITEVSMDRIRAQLKVSPEHNQGRVVQAAQEAARVLLRERRDFVWNNTCVTAQTRGRIIQLCRDYDAHVTVVNMITPWAVSQQRNRARTNPVPDSVVLRMLHKWQPASHTEAHELVWTQT